MTVHQGQSHSFQVLRYHLSRGNIHTGACLEAYCDMDAAILRHCTDIGAYIKVELSYYIEAMEIEWNNQ